MKIKEKFVFSNKLTLLQKFEVAWLDKKLTYLDGLLPIMSYDPIVTRSRDKLKPSYLHYHNVYENQNLQDDELP